MKGALYGAAAGAAGAAFLSWGLPVTATSALFVGVFAVVSAVLGVAIAVAHDEGGL